MKLRKKITALFTTLIVCGSVLVQPMTVYAATVDDIVIDNTVDTSLFTDGYINVHDYSFATDSLDAFSRKDSDGNIVTGGDDYDLGNIEGVWRDNFERLNTQTGSAETPAMNTFIKVFSEIKTKDGLLIVDNVHSGDTLTTRVVEGVLGEGYTLDDSTDILVSIYSVGSTSRAEAGVGGSDALAEAVYAGCDYNTKDGKYYYYTVVCDAVSYNPDTLSIVVFDSEHLLFPGDAVSKVKVNTSGFNNWYREYDYSLLDGLSEAFSNNLNTILNNLLTYNGVHIVDYILDDNIDNNTKSILIHRLELIDDLLKIDNVGSNSFNLKVNASAGYRMHTTLNSDSHNGLRAGYGTVKFTLETASLLEGINYNEGVNIVFDESYVYFGEGGVIGIAEGRTTGHDAIDKLVTDTLSKISISAGSDTDVMIADLKNVFNPANNNLPSSFLYTLLDVYGTTLQQSIDGQRIKPITSEDLKMLSLLMILVW